MAEKCTSVNVWAVNVNIMIYFYCICCAPVTVDVTAPAMIVGKIPVKRYEWHIG